MIIQERLLIPSQTISDVILANGSTDQTTSFPNFAALPSAELENCLVKSLPVDSQQRRTYFYYGNCTNNYVQFGTINGEAILWRVMRITEHGNVRLVKVTNIGSSTYKTPMASLADLPYPTSTLKPVIDSWWLTTNLGTLYTVGKVVDEPFYNDWTAYETIGNNTYTLTRHRLWANYGIQKPEFAPTNPSETLSVASNTLTYPVCIASLDEVAASGTVQNIAQNLSLLPWGYNGWALGSDMYITSSSRWLMGTFLSGGTFGHYDINSTVPIIPCINISPNCIVTSGTGTSTDPYIIV